MDNTELIPARSLKDLLKQPQYESAFRRVLGSRAPQFVSSIISVGNTMADVEPKSIIGSAMTAATLDLPIDKNLGFAWIVPYKKGAIKLAQFQMGYRGYIQLGLRTGQYSRMNARPINREVFKGWDDCGDPILDWTALDESKEVFGYAFTFKTVNGFLKPCLWTKERVIKHAERYSQAYRGGYETPWKTHFDRMAMKTVIANELRNWGILSVEMRTAIKADQAVILDVDAEPVYVDDVKSIPETTTPKFDTPAQQTAPATTDTAAPVKRIGRPPGSKNKPTSAPTTPPGQPEQPFTPSSDPIPMDFPQNPPQSEQQAAPVKSGIEFNYFKGVTGLMKLANIEEAKLLDYMRQKGMIDEALSSLAEVSMIQPSQLKTVYDHWQAIAENIHETKK